MLTSLGLIFLTGMALGWICRKCRLPGLLGMMAAGILLGPCVLNLLDDSILNISADLRQIALIIILTRAGLSLNLEDLKKVGRPAVLLCFVPASFEMAGIVLLAPPLLHISYGEAAILGAVLAAVSPAVIVPKMLKLMEEKRGTGKSIPQMLLAGASVDDVFVIVMFTSFMGLEQGGSFSPLTLVQMSSWHGVELAMNAGIDIAIGDFVFEFDSVEMPYQPGLLMDCYAKALQGYDIVWACPRRSRHGRRQLFYRIFNASFDSAYRMREDAFRLVSRRALNRVHAISSMPPYRKAAYAASGLKLANLEFEPSFPPRQKDKNPYTKALDSLALYTDMFYRLSLGISLVLLVLTMAFGIYTVVIYASPVRQVEGWTSTMLVMCVGFFGIFLMLTIVIKYLSLLVDLVFKKQRYLVEGIEKIQR